MKFLEKNTVYPVCVKNVKIPFSELIKMISQIKAIDTCIKWEKILRPMGYHIGLTGSCLYGPEIKSDIDVIIYPHIEKDGSRQDRDCKFILEKLGIKKVKHTFKAPLSNEEYNELVDYIYIGQYENMKIDAFFLE